MYMLNRSEDKRWRLTVVSCLLLVASPTRTNNLNDEDNSIIDPATESQIWPLEVMLELTGMAELREFVRNFSMDETTCSSKALYELVVGEESTDIAGYEWWRKQCGAKHDFTRLGFPDFFDDSWPRRRRDVSKRRIKRYHGLTSRQWRKLEKLIKKMYCKPKKTMVELPKGNDLAVQLKPPCVYIKRCSGCCDSPLLECRPTEISQKEFKVIAMGGRMTSQVVKVEEHKSCKCSCKEREEHCNKTIHRYDAGTCSCKCISGMTNCSIDKVWDEKLCACVCKKKKTCRVGRHFDADSCRCLRI